MEELRIDLNQLYESKLRLEEWFILYCLYENKETLLVEYTIKCNKIETKTFELLYHKGYLNVVDFSNITFDSISLTDSGNSIFKQKIINIKQEIEPLFEEIKKLYPSKVGYRRLHGSNQKCIQIYFKTLVHGNIINKELHENIKKCIQICVSEHKKANKLEFMKNLETFLNQRAWEQYLGDINKEITIPKTNFDAI